MDKNIQTSGIFRKITVYSGIFAAAMGVLSLVGWFSKYIILTNFGEPYKKLSPHGSIMLIVLGGLLILYELYKQDKAVLRIIRYTAAAIAAIEAWSFIDFISGTDLLFDEFVIYIFSGLTGRNIPPISPLAVAPALVAGCLFIILSLPAEKARLKKITGALSLAIFSTGSVIIIGYVYQTPLLYGSGIEPTALPIGIGIFFIGLGLISAGPNVWPLNAMRGESARSVLLRYILPTVIVSVIITDIAMVILTKRTNINPALLEAVNIISAVILISIVIFRLSGIIGAAIKRAEMETQQAEKKLSVLVVFITC